MESLVVHYGEDVGDVVLNALQLSTTAEKCSKNIAIVPRLYRTWDL